VQSRRQRLQGMSLVDNKLSYRLENRASTLVHSSHQKSTREHLFFFEFSYTLRVGFFLAKIHGNGRTRVDKNNTHISLTCPF